MTYNRSLDEDKRIGELSRKGGLKSWAKKKKWLWGFTPKQSERRREV